MYVNGVADGIGLIVNSLTDGKKHIFCADQNVTAGQKYRVVLKYVKGHPAQANWQTRELVMTALIDAFPCHEQAAPAK